MRSAGQQRVFGTLRQGRQGGEDGGQLLQEDVMRLSHLEELPGLRYILRGRTPVHVPTSVSLTDPVQFPDEWHERVARARQPGVYGFQVNVREVRLTRNLLGSAGRDDAQVSLRQCQRRFHIEPRLEARCFGEQGAHARIFNPE